MSMEGNQFTDSEEFRRRLYEKPNPADIKLDDDLDDLLDGLEDLAEDDRDAGADHTPSTVTAATRAPTARTPQNGFPVGDVDTLPIVVDASAALETLMAALSRHGDYHLIRDEYCRLSILLNLQGRLAPAFRPKPNPGKRKGNPVFLEIHRDQVVIDCHWLYCRRQMVKVRDSEFRPLFRRAQPFPFDLAWTFANKVWKKAHRADEAFSLTPFQQCQLAALRGVRVSTRFTAALEGVRKPGARIPPKVALVRQRLAEWCERNRRIVPLFDDYERLWLAREVLGPDASVSLIAELFALMTGQDVRAEKTISDKLKRMDGHIGGE